MITRSKDKSLTKFSLIKANTTSKLLYYKLLIELYNAVSEQTGLKTGDLNK